MADTQYPHPWSLTKLRLLDLFPSQVRGDSAATRNQRAVSLAHLRNVQAADTELTLSTNPDLLWELVKPLTMSDVGNNQTRLMIPKDYVVARILDHLTDEEKRMVNEGRGQGLRISVYDSDTESVHDLSFKKWVSSGSYVLINNWNKEFVRRRELRVGDTIGLFWNTFASRLHFCVLSRRSNH